MILLIVMSVNAFSQKTKQSTSNLLEIDRLYGKYKDIESTTILFPGGSLEGNIHIDMNDQNKPSEIRISGGTINTKDLSQFIFDFIRQKINKGFRQVGENGNDASFIEFELDHLDKPLEIKLIKGKEYTTIYCYREKQNYFANALNGNNMNSHDYKYVNFELTTGDMRRVIGSREQPFDF